MRDHRRHWTENLDHPGRGKLRVASGLPGLPAKLPKSGYFSGWSRLFILTAPSDLVVKLVSPGGTVMTLLNRPGVAEPNDWGTDVARFRGAAVSAAAPVMWRDDARVSAERLGAGGLAACPSRESAAGCVFRPSRGAAVGPESFAQLSGQVAVGRWRLCVGDAQPGQAGRVERMVLRTTLRP